MGWKVLRRGVADLHRRGFVIFNPLSWPSVRILFKAFQQDMQDGQDKRRRLMNGYENKLPM